MNNQTVIPKWFWVIGVLALLWNLMGCLAFASDMMMTPEALASLPEDHQRLYLENPLWAKLAYGVAVIAGTIGSLGLLLRKGWALPAFVLSLLGVLIQQLNIYFISDMLNIIGTSAVPLMMSVLVVAILLVFFSRRAKVKGWIV